PFDERLCQLVELLVVAALHVDLDEIETGLRNGGVECLTEGRCDPAHLPEPGGVEAASVTQHLADGLVLPGRHLLEHVELPRDELEAERAAAKQPKRSSELAGAQMFRRARDLRRPELEPELRRLVHGLEQELVWVRALFC